MKYTSAIVLAAASQAAAGAISHGHVRGKVHNHALRHAEIKADEQYVPLTSEHACAQSAAMRSHPLLAVLTVN